MELITSQSDLEYVNESLERVCFAGEITSPARSRSQTEEMTPHRTRARGIAITKKSNIEAIYENLKPRVPLTPTMFFKSDRNVVSPDSEIPCDDLECPISVPHNTGRYYAGGIKARDSVDDIYQALCSTRMEPVSHSFNYTVPPPEVVEAHVRIWQGCPKTDDEDLVRNYKRMHIYSPITSGRPTPPPTPSSQQNRIYCKIIDPDKHHTIRQDQLHKALQAKAKGLLDSMPQSSPTKFHIREGNPQQIGQNIESVPVPNHSNSSTAPVHPLKAFETRQSSMKMARTRRSSDLRKLRDDENVENRKRVPRGEALREAQLRIKERIIDRIAQQAMLNSESNSLAGGVSSSDESRHSISSDEDVLSDAGTSSSSGFASTHRQLEVHAAVIRKLERDLQNGLLQQYVVLDDKRQEIYDPNVKETYLNCLLLLVQRGYRELTGNLTSEYDPTGLQVTTQEVEELCEQYIEKYEMLRKKYPHMPVEAIIRSLNRAGFRIRLSNLR